MKSLNIFQNTQDKGVSSLASQFMDMFDASKLDTSLLRKRELQTQDNLYQMQKKIKASSNDLTMPSPLQMTGLNPMLYNLNYTFNPMLATGFQPDLVRASQLQNIALLAQQKEALLGLQPLTFPHQNSFQSQLFMTKQEQPSVKQEYIKQEELPTSQGSPSSQPLKSVQGDNNESSPVNNEPSEITEPALVDFTREFPDWDLATIFGYIKSGKTRELFEKEKQCKIERKLRRKKLRMAAKEKGAATEQNKTVRAKRMTGKTQ